MKILLNMVIQSFLALSLGYVLLCATGTAQAATTYTFTNTLAGAKAWNVAAGNWDANGVPVGATDATIAFFSDITTALGQPTITINTDPTTLTQNTLTLNGRGAAATANTIVNLGTAGNTWTFDGTTPTVNLNGVNGTKNLTFTNAPNLTLNKDITFTGNGTAGFVFSGAISEAGGARMLTKSGSSTLTLSGANTYSGNTTINGGRLTVANGGAIYSPKATLNVLAGTNALATGGSITVQQLLVTNNTISATNSFFTFSGGTLITSNAANAIAAKILIPSNTAFTINGNWTMNGGSNLIAFVQTNGAFANSYIASSGGNLRLNINSNAVLQIGDASYSTSANMYFGGGSSNTLTIDNGTLAVVNGMRFLISGNSNTLNIINGGQLLRTSSYFVMGDVSTSNNYVYMGGTNSAGVRATLIEQGTVTIYGAYNGCEVDQGGTLGGTAFLLRQGVASYLMITNGGQATFSSSDSYIGRYGAVSNGYVMVVGTGTDGSNASFNLLSAKMHIGSDGTYGSNDSNRLLVGQGGRVTMGGLYVASESGNYNTGNYLIVTNGGQVVVSGAGQIGASSGNANNGNWAYVGGAGALLDFRTNAITLGGTGANTNNILTVDAGGILTNVTTITLAGINSSFNLAGDAYVTNVNLSGSTAEMNFTNGGVLHARASGTLLSGTGTNYFLTGSGTIDTVGFTVTNSVSGAGSGSLTKLGTGTLVLTGTNTYTGETIVSNGVLRLTQTQGLSINTAVVIGSDGKMSLDFSGTNTVRSLTVNGVLQKGNTVYNKSNLSVLSGTGFGSGSLLTIEGEKPKGTMIKFL
ncbi:MAG: autotransporter-associated beta strand repeat-containing protein [bacterium]